MFILGFDTSNAYSSVAISKGSEIIYAKKDYEPNTQAERLIIMIENALKKKNLEYIDLQYLAVSAGPGSFTGIRIALAAAKGILLACPSIKPVCINNFETINFRVRQQILSYDIAISCVNAFRDEIYLQFFQYKDKEKEAMHLSLNEAKKLIESIKGKVVISGSGINHIYNAENLPPSNIQILPRFAQPDARFVCRVAHQQIVQNKENAVISALYIREPDAKLPNL